MSRVIVVDDDPSICRAVKAGLEARGYQVAVATTGRAAISAIAAKPPDLVLLDLGLPDIDGVDVVSRVREWSDLPIIVLSADGAEHRKVRALDEGADDYVTKPFSMPELLARVRVAERHRTARRAAPDESVYTVGDLTIDVAHHTCTVGGRTVELTPKEFGFVSLLAKWQGRVLTHRMILQEVWGPEYGTETQYLRTYATNIRKKLGDPPGGARLVSKPGVGYVLLDITQPDRSDGGEAGQSAEHGGGESSEAP